MKAIRFVALVIVLVLLSGFTAEEPKNRSEFICGLAVGIIDEQTILVSPKPEGYYFSDSKGKKILGKVTVKEGETFKFVHVHLSWTYEFLGIRSGKILLSQEFRDAHSRDDVQTKKTLIAVAPTEKPKECPETF